VFLDKDRFNYLLYGLLLILLSGCSEGPALSKDALKPPMGAKFPALVMESVAPANGAVKVSIRPRLVLRFNNQVDASSLVVNTSTSACSGTVQLSKDNFFTCEKLVPAISEDGGFSYSIWAGNNLEILTQYKIMVTGEVKDIIGKNLTNPYLSTIGFMTEDNIKPEVVSTIPFSGTVDVAQNEPISITFSKAMNSNTITTNIGTELCLGSFQLSKNGFSSCVPMALSPIASPDLKTFSVIPVIYLESDVTYQIRAIQTMQDMAGNNLAYQYVGQGFKVKDWNAPTVNSTFPQSNTVEIPLDTSIIITFSEEMDKESITVNTENDTCSGSIQLSRDGLGTCTQFITNPTTANGLTFSVTPLSDLIQGSSYQIKITQDAKDQAGNGIFEAPFTSNFSTLALPGVVSVIPSSGEKGIPYEATITVTFNKPVDPSSVFTDPNTSSCSVGTFVVSTKEGSFVDGSCIPLQLAVASNGNRTFSARGVLPFDDQAILRVKISDGIRDPLGFSPASDFFQDGSWQIIDTTPPQVASVRPGDEELHVLVNAQVILKFNEMMDVASLSNVQISDGICDGPIQLSYNDFVTCVAFDSDAPEYNLEQTEFTLIPKVILDTSSEYKIKITTVAQDTQGNNMAQNFMASFTTIQNLSVSATTPQDLPTPLIPRDSSITVTFDRAMNASTITAQIDADDCAGSIQVSTVDLNFSSCVIFSENPIANDEGTTWTLTPKVPLSDYTTYKIKVLNTVEDLYGSSLKNNYLQSNGFKTEILSVASTVPNDNDMFIDRNTAITVTFDGPMDPLSITTNTADTTCFETIQVSNDDFSSCVEMSGQPIGDPTATTWFVTPANTLNNFTTYKIRVTTDAKDQYGNNFATSFIQPNGFTTIDDIPPEVLATIPTAGTVAVPVDATITVQFSEPMDAATMGTSTIELQVGPDFATKVSGTITSTNNDQDFIFTPLNDLNNIGTIYKIIVRDTAKDSQGNSLESEYVSTFRSLDEVAPSVVGFTPIDGAINININGEISVTFSEDINPNTLITNVSGDLNCTGKSWYATDGGPSCFEMDPYISEDGLNRIFKMTPSSYWERDETITIFLTNSITDPMGATLTNPTSYSFTTNNPGLASLTVPGDGAVDVLFDSVIEINWDRPMDINSMALNNSDSSCSGDIQVSQDNFATCVQMSSILPSNLGGELYRLVPANNLAADTTFTVRVMTSVLNMATSTSVGWPVDQDFTFTSTVPPIVSGVEPLDNAISIPRSASITVTFNKGMNATTITTNSVDDFCSGSFQLSSDPAFLTCIQMVAAPVQNTPDEYSIQPAAVLANQTQYFLKVTTAVEDSIGQQMLSDFISDFTTIDDIVPKILSSSPLATNIIPTTSISATFSDSMEVSTFSTTLTSIPCDNSITLQVSSDSFVTCLGTSAPVFTSNDTIVTVTPINYLPNSTSIENRILSTVTDLAGNQLGTDTSWTFSTGDAPLVGAINPTEGEDYVPENTIIQIAFNKTVDPGLLTSDNDSSCTSGKIHISTDASFATGNCLPLTALVWSSTSEATLTASGGTFLPETQYFLRIDSDGVQDIEWNLLMESSFNSNFTTVSTTPPILSLPTIPADGLSDVSENQSVQVSFDKVMDGTTITTNNGTTSCTGSVQVSLDDFSTCHPLNTPVPASNADTYVISLTSQYLSSTTYKLKVLGAPSAPTATADPSGNYIASDYLQSVGFTVGDFIIPYVVSSDPVAGTDTNTNPIFNIEFSEEMEVNTLSTFTGILTGPCPATNSVGFLLSEDSNFTTCVPMDTSLGQTVDDINYSFNLAQGLKNNTTYWYLVSTHAMDKGGNNVATSTVISFMANDLGDNYPTIISPSDKATNVNYDTSVLAFELSFDKDVDPTSLTNNSSGTGCTGNILLSRQADDFSECLKWATEPATTTDFKSFNLGTLESFLDQDTTYVLKISKDIVNATGTPTLLNDYYFSFTTGGAPHVTEMLPANGTVNFSVNGELFITFDKQMDPTSIPGAGGSCNSGAVDVSLNTYVNCVELDVVDLDGGYTFRLTPKTLFTKKKTYKWRVNTNARDISGFPLGSNSSELTFTVGDYLSVISSNPGNKATGVSNNPTISITFSEDMNKGSVWTNEGSSNCEGSVRLSDDKVIGCLPLLAVTDNGAIVFNTSPVSTLPLSNYTVTVTTEVEALFGSNLKEEYAFRFSTGNPPQVVSHTPAKDATGVLTNTNIVFDFSTAMNPITITTNSGSTICAGTIRLKVQGSDECIALSDPTNTGGISFTVVPVGPLDPTQTYEVLVINNVESDPGLPMFDDYQWSFTTDNTLTNFEKMGDRFFGKGIRCTPLMETKNSTGKKVRVSWKQNKEELVNSLGGGYEVFYKRGKGIFCSKIPYIEGEWTPSDANLNLSSGRWFIRVKAYSRLNKGGSAFSKVITIDVP